MESIAWVLIAVLAVLILIVGIASRSRRLPSYDLEHQTIFFNGTTGSINIRATGINLEALSTILRRGSIIRLEQNPTLTSSEIDKRFPAVPLSAITGLQDAIQKNGDTQQEADITEALAYNTDEGDSLIFCTICQCTIGVDDEEKQDSKVLVRILPCGHSYHADCITQWLCEYHCTCPVCLHTYLPMSLHE